MKAKQLLFSMAAVAMLAGGSMTANAQPKTMEDGTVFDAEYYAQQYPDVVAVYGTKEADLYKHYQEYGRAENRAAVAASDKSGFDAKYYAQQNPDVVAVYGTDSDSLYQHYIEYGKKEGRLPAASKETVAPAAPEAPADNAVSGTTKKYSDAEIPEWIKHPAFNTIERIPGYQMASPEEQAIMKEMWKQYYGY